MHFEDTENFDCDNAIISAYKRNPDINSDIFFIDQDTADDIASCLSSSPLVLATNKTLTLESTIKWESPHDFTLISRHSIEFLEGSILANSNSASVIIKAGMNDPDQLGTVIFNEHSGIAITDGNIKIYYNPSKGDNKHKYHGVIDYYGHVSPEERTDTFMWVNNIEDLQDMQYALYRTFALSQDIDCSNLEEKFQPITRFLKLTHDQVPFSGTFDGNGHTIKNLVINYPEHNNVGLFSFCASTEFKPVKISNLIVENCIVEGNIRVGTICGKAQYTEINNVTVRNSTVKGNKVVGGVIGAAVLSTFSNITTDNVEVLSANQIKGTLAGAAVESKFITPIDTDKVGLIGHDLETNMFDIIIES